VNLVLPLRLHVLWSPVRSATAGVAMRLQFSQGLALWRALLARQASAQDDENVGAQSKRLAAGGSLAGNDSSDASSTGVHGRLGRSRIASGPAARTCTSLSRVPTALPSRNAAFGFLGGGVVLRIVSALLLNNPNEARSQKLRWGAARSEPEAANARSASALATECGAERERRSRHASLLARLVQCLPR